MDATQLQDLQEALVMVLGPWVVQAVLWMTAIGFFATISWILLSFLSRALSQR